jgi:chromosome segregation ATPase
MKPLVTVFAVMMLLTSCVDNTVPELVNQIRTAQVNLANARTRLAEAQAASVEIQNEYDAASNAIQLQIAESGLAVTLAQNEANLVWAQQDLEQAELNLQIAIDALADYLEQNDLSEAAQYLDNYSDAMFSANNTRSSIIAQQNVITTLELFLSPGGSPGITLALWLEMLERDLATAEAKLAAEEAALAALEAVAADPATANAAAAEIAADIEALAQAGTKLNVEKKQLDVARDQAHDAVVTITGGNLSASAGGGAVANPIIPTFEEAEEDATEAAEELEITELEVANLESDKVEVEADIAVLQTQLDNYTSELVGKFGNLGNKKNSAIALGNTVKDKIIERDILLAQGVAGATLTAAETALTSAQTAFEAVVGDYAQAGTFYTEAEVDDAIDFPVDIPASTATDYESAITQYNVAANFFTFGQPAYNLIDDIGKYNADFFLSNFEASGTLAGVPVQSSPNGLTEDLEDIQDDIDEKTNGYDDEPDGDFNGPFDVKGIVQLEQDLADAEETVAELQAAYDDAVANLSDLQAAEEAANDAVTAKAAEILATSTMKTQLESVQGTITTQLNSINTVIEAKKDAIEVTRNSIANLEASIVERTFDVTEVESKIAQEEAELAVFEAELAAFLAEAAKWKALLDASLD